MRKISRFLWIPILFLTACHNNGFDVLNHQQEMPNNHLSFKEIANYQDYHIIATHFRKDKNELRYILGNKIAYEALKTNRLPLPDGSKIVKIGWKVREMPNFKPAMEAKQLQRIEYMIKDKNNFSHNPGNWGYARFVKKDGRYSAWQKGTQSCVSCHNVAKENDFVFSRFQKME